MSKMQKPPLTIAIKTPEQVEQEAINAEIRRTGTPSSSDLTVKPDEPKALTAIPKEFQGSSKTRKPTSYRISESSRNLIDLLYRCEKNIDNPRKKEDIVEDAIQSYLKTELEKHGYNINL